MAERGQWGSRLGFILAAAGSAVGLGNIWRFPYTAGEGGGGYFVLVYLVAVALVGLPIMIAEILIGRRAQRSPVPAFIELSGRINRNQVAWSLVGWMGVVAGFAILSFYSVVGGWTMHYVGLAVRGGLDTEGHFASLVGSPGLSLFWHTLFMAITMFIVLGGIRRGVEVAARVLMPALFLLLLGLLVFATTLPGFGNAVDFLFAPKAENVTPGGILGGLGQAFFSLSLGMGALITYGSYLRRDTDIGQSAVSISLLDTLVALLAGLILFPIVFTTGGDPGAGTGLVFIAMPAAFAKMTGGYVLGIVFFVLLLFAALTSGISLLEVVVATVIDQLGWSRRRAIFLLGSAIWILGIPSALGEAGHLDFWKELTGKIFAEPKGFLDTVDYVTANWLLPLGGLLIAVFAGWVLPEAETRDELETGSRWGQLYPVWRFLIRYAVPVVILLVFLVSIGAIPEAWLK